MIICEDNYPQILDTIAQKLTNADIELLLVDTKTMHQINLKERKIDKTTDVLSFPLHYIPHFSIGSIVINTDLALSKASELGHSIDDEIALLFTHGLLHILGYDHENDDGQMRRKEIEIINEFNLPDSLIVRTLDE
ncbi:rRNA maturation RNase YbeY [Campylobacter sp. CX2-8023-23]|uniref:rRNA maturation RNase YbeY n=1 Tax=Campylobacter porcelli TaxID=1660073 RepID=UPI002EB455C5|nr:rRNA maturation RNase YbeY [Campylobacter sp. CX2-8023-23]MEE3777175.1 rRNA maturation RNase YbeY [Campylobacter sp. CX2-4080-23]